MFSAFLCIWFSLIDLVPADQRFDAADQFIIGKRFGQIVVSSAGKTEQLIAFLRLRT